ncbi:MAG: hypothetical protein ACLQBK_13065 [Candidatus Sulfotelmatobacter sp.]
MRESRYLASKFKEFTVQSVILLRAEMSKVFDLAAKLPLPPNRRDGKDRSG